MFGETPFASASRPRAASRCIARRSTPRSRPRMPLRRLPGRAWRRWPRGCVVWLVRSCRARRRRSVNREIVVLREVRAGHRHPSPVPPRPRRRSPRRRPELRHRVLVQQHRARCRPRPAPGRRGSPRNMGSRRCAPRDRFLHHRGQVFPSRVRSVRSRGRVTGTSEGRTRTRMKDGAEREPRSAPTFVCRSRPTRVLTGVLSDLALGPTARPPRAPCRAAPRPAASARRPAPGPPRGRPPRTAGR